ncbi:MAG: molybdopterin molybdotransferase MoeA [Desulfobacterales bacterium]|jgi:molybdopterin molybdotransferase|nr:molybdopterin molybdotransferase MoeA [Desulfobacterales bacterium]
MLTDIAMDDFFHVTDLMTVISYAEAFQPLGTERIPLSDALGRVLGEELVSRVDLPDFVRSTMDGFAVRAASTFGASEANPAYLTIVGAVLMGERPDFSIGPGEAAKISTGGALPAGADSVVIIEHTEAIDEFTIELYKSAAPGQHVVQVGEDFAAGARVLQPGRVLRPQDIGLLAALGKDTLTVYSKARIGIISTGDEVVPIQETPGPGKIRDVNAYTLAAMVSDAGAIPIRYGIVKDDSEQLFELCHRALKTSDMLLISGGSSVGTRDFTVEVLSRLSNAKILVHGIPISPGKPTILARAGQIPIWGLPGHVVSSMVVFKAVVKPFIDRINGMIAHGGKAAWPVPARMARNISSAQGRTDYIRVRLIEKEDGFWAEPVLGKSGLLNTMIRADGLVAIDLNTEGLEKGTLVSVMPI